MADNKPAAQGTPYTRLALPSEFRSLAQLAAKSFINDPLFNWSANRRSVKATATETKNLQLFHKSFMEAIFAVGGRIVVVAVPGVDGAPERVVAVSEWLLPNQSMDGLFTLVKAGFHKSVIAWGWTGYKRLNIQYLPTIIKRKYAALKARGYSLKEGNYHLEMIFTDPDEAGKGYCGMLLAEAEAAFEAGSTSSDLLFTLEATTPKSQAVYMHRGWEVLETLTFEKGIVDARGLPASSSDATGFPIAIMIKRKSKKSES